MQVTVSDINDNSPQFVNSPYSATIAESLSGGSSVVHISATDNDTGTNAEIVYKLVTATPATGLTQFELDTDSGLLRTKPVSLDYETVKSYTFEVSASDKGSPPQTVRQRPFHSLPFPRTFRFAGENYNQSDHNGCQRQRPDFCWFAVQQDVGGRSEQ